MSEIFRLPEMGPGEVKEVMDEQIVCRMAFGKGEHPSISLFQYTQLGGSLFFHFTEYGEKMDSLDGCNQASVEIEDLTEDLGEFRFVLLKGRLQKVEDPIRKAQVIRKMASEGEKRLSTKFLAAHGFHKGSDWSSFMQKVSMTIVEFIPSEVKGLKSP